MAPRRFFKLNVNLILSVVLLALGFLVINYLHYRSNDKIFRQGLAESSMPIIANAVSVSMDEVNSNYALVSRLFAASFDRSLLSSRGEDGERIQEYLRTWSAILGAKNIGVVSLASGRYYDLTQNLQLDLDSPRDAWVNEFLAQKEDYRYSFYDPDEDDGALYSFFHDFKIRNLDEEVVAVIGLGLSYQKVYDRVKGLHEGLQIAFLDRSGNFRLPLERRKLDPEEIYGLDLSFIKDENHQAADDPSAGWTSPAAGREGSEAGEDHILWSKRGNRELLILIRFLPRIQRYLLLELDVTDPLQEFRQQNNAGVLAVVLLSVLVISSHLIYLFIANHRLSAKAYTDALTGCSNREYLNSYLGRERREREVAPLLLVFDIDRFKGINDSQGHEAGDRILQQVSRIVRTHLRSNDLFIRWGGDEFLLLLYADDEAARQIAERIRCSVVEETEVSISLGMTRQDEDESFSHAFERADDALYRAKGEGRNRMVFYPEPSHPSRRP